MLVPHITYSDAEFDAFLNVKTSGNLGFLSKEALVEYSHHVGRRITPADLQKLLNGEDVAKAQEAIVAEFETRKEAMEGGGA